ncbi:MAG TPA: protein kinase, partial [Polyangiaceae bacterium]|nr:protein kinase [Polyangiaceae bacterium]
MVERPALLRPGEMFEGFRIVRLLGRGGVGDVFEIAYQGRRMALKVVRLPQGCDERQLQKLLREGRIQGWIKHPNVVEVFETGVTRTGLAWIRMELLRGLTARDVLHVQGTLSIALTVHYLRQVGIALQQCHRLGAVHRDTKPENLFVLADHRLKLLDFGIAKLYGTGETSEGGCKGTPPYMAPEQLRGRPVTPATDVYAVGLIAHEMLWGAHPFVEDLSSYDPHALISRQFFESPPSLAEVGVPEPMARVVARALAKDPEARQQDGLSFAEDVWAAWERMREAAPELDTLESETALEPGAGRAAIRAASFGAPSDAATRRLPVRGTAGRARTVRLPDTERDPSCVKALSAREEATREAGGVETGGSSPPERSEVRVRVPEGRRFDTATLPAAKPLEGRSRRDEPEGAETRLEAPVVVVARATRAQAKSAQPAAPQAAGLGEASSPRSAGRRERGRGLRVAERAGMLLLGLLAGMVLGSMVSVHGEEARGGPASGEPRPSAQRPGTHAPAAASPQPESQRTSQPQAQPEAQPDSAPGASVKAPEPVPKAAEERASAERPEASAAPVTARSVPEGLPKTNPKTNTNT